MCTFCSKNVQLSSQVRWLEDVKDNSIQLGQQVVVEFDSSNTGALTLDKETTIKY